MKAKPHRHMYSWRSICRLCPHETRHKTRNTERNTKPDKRHKARHTTDNMEPVHYSLHTHDTGGTPFYTLCDFQHLVVDIITWPYFYFFTTSHNTSTCNNPHSQCLIITDS